MRISLTPFLLAAQLGFLLVIARRAHGRTPELVAARTVAACVAPAVHSRDLRRSLAAILEASPWSCLAGLQALRISALGTSPGPWPWRPWSWSRSSCC